MQNLFVRIMGVKGFTQKEILPLHWQPDSMFNYKQ